MDILWKINRDSSIFYQNLSIVYRKYNILLKINRDLYIFSRNLLIVYRKYIDNVSKIYRSVPKIYR